MNCANHLFDLVNFTKEQANHLCSFVSEMPAGEDRFAQRNRAAVAYKWSILDEQYVNKKMVAAEINLDRV